LEVFDDEFYVEPSPDSEEPSRKKKHQTFIKNPLYGIGVTMLSCHHNNRFFNDNYYFQFLTSLVIQKKTEMHVITL